MQVFKVVCFILFLFGFSSNVLASRTVVNIGGYNYPPFIEWKSGRPKGIMVALTDMLNETQKKYRFNLVETSANRRYEDLRYKNFDVIFFENIQWGWDKNEVLASKVFLQGGEVFITKTGPGKNQTYFNDLKNKSIRGILGYHYSFANFSTEPAYLKKWNLQLTNSIEGNITSVLDSRSDLAIVTKEYLDIFLKRNPEAKKMILVSERLDQIYRHTVLVRKYSIITVKEINDLLDKIKRDKMFNDILLDF